MAADRADFGLRLRAAREARGVSLRQIATTTKISVLALEALERNDVSRLPGGLFSRAFVRAYAKEVGLDPEQAVREFVERFEEAGGEPDAPEAVRVRTASSSEPGNQYRLRWIGLAVTVVLVIAWIGVDRYFSRRAELPPTPTQGARKDATAPVPAAPALPKPEPAPVPSPPIEQSSAAPAAAPLGAVPAAADVNAAPRNLALNVVLTSKAACWVSATVDGQRVPGRTLQPGEKLELSAGRSIVLTAGDAAALSYTINNAPGRPLGASGEVKTVVITTANYRTFVAGRQ